MRWLVLILLAVTVFVLIPSVVTFFVSFFGRHSADEAMKKEYFAPYRQEMDAAIAWFSGLEAQSVTITARDGVPLRGKFYDRGNGKTAILLHGYTASALSNFCVSGRAFWERGYSLLLVDQRAHGESGGRFTGLGLVERYDLLDWIDWTEGNTRTDKMVIYGISMGCAALAYASDRLDRSRVRAMVLDCGFISVYRQMVHTSEERGIPWRVMMPIVRLCARLLTGADISLPVTQALQRTTVPAFFLHGEADKAVPVEEGRANFAACASEKEARFVPGAAHTMSFITGGEEVQNALFDFIERHM